MSGLPLGVGRGGVTPYGHRFPLFGLVPNRYHAAKQTMLQRAHLGGLPQGRQNSQCSRVLSECAKSRVPGRVREESGKHQIGGGVERWRGMTMDGTGAQPERAEHV